MRTLNDNYNKNVEILKENLRRGMTIQQASQAIDHMVAQFKQANLYNNDAKAYILVMRGAIIEHFAHITVNVA
jgi:hypothetical protein